MGTGLGAWIAAYAAMTMGWASTGRPALAFTRISTRLDRVLIGAIYSVQMGVGAGATVRVAQTDGATAVDQNRTVPEAEAPPGAIDLTAADLSQLGFTAEEVAQLSTVRQSRYRRELDLSGSEVQRLQFLRWLIEQRRVGEHETA